MSTARNARYSEALYELQASLTDRFQVAGLLQRWDMGRYAGTLVFQGSFEPFWADTLEEGKAKIMAAQEEAYEASFELAQTCSICDALGHGYPGAGPCPLEETGYWEARADEERYGF